MITFLGIRGKNEGDCLLLGATITGALAFHAGVLWFRAMRLAARGESVVLGLSVFDTMAVFFATC